MNIDRTVAECPRKAADQLEIRLDDGQNLGDMRRRVLRKAINQPHPRRLLAATSTGLCPMDSRSYSTSGLPGCNCFSNVVWRLTLGRKPIASMATIMTSSTATPNAGAPILSRNAINAATVVAIVV